ncbi:MULTISPECIES: 3-methyl-2-oxobutanoate hydroxymethyltransferase [Thermoactinomyces]|jgi:3-methyl-2-oxobutanoate hydroxymethyltransferase|uniref:3-methyl-2-oxobutanoate hydroxymethyltransferase n=1 Tax=Thermoactinomyces vulgaris TaxID=2026 RepID=A0ABS0QDL2_THEVU|nr:MULTISPECIES: 3-methyl-2-oxobutanoate hydroxymethyltransferase [Thermoactinomyces]KFZ40497.1 3-methyl-2-oxobutanoate hydroxymethyltransferase [Thermoactinomyces sp. Gus2-1]MBA4550464.1 3-methyl-2-oxobutanoate hydroxymethyltransferase [Thermoactinomyces vulgaris]MBA4595875.1 3-methyl-2-oxobutanoate hydroxymethyltransferase [Thermoactinomyces vulgaris]MBH8584856.1 3-methyl-2-oxobutanoate hydroxymethyltransferase [Thermoactinomyces sp. CICC 10520]MBH8587340.1 3-methyl-2-oxobutanoate hydroxymet
MTGKKVTKRTLLGMKQKQEPIAMITAYDYPSARLAEEAGADILLVGDSLGMVVLGYDSTIPVTLDDMLHHTKAVTRGAKKAMVIADLPFATAHLPEGEVLKSAARLMQEGLAYGVKMEGGIEIVDKVNNLTMAGIPVMGHLGLTPQSVNQLGGYLIQGKDLPAARRLLDAAQRLEEAGAFAIVLECVPEELAELVTKKVGIPVIGIGAGRHCDGQVLVYHDLLAMAGDFRPSFVKVYQDAGKVIRKGIADYVQEVKERSFPAENHVTHLKDELIHELYGSSEGETDQ